MENQNSADVTVSNESSNLNFNPLKEAVEHKQQKQVQVDPTLLAHDIPEPVINLSSVQNEEDIFSSPQFNGQKQNSASIGATNGQPKKTAAFNPALNDLPPSQKKQSAEYLANIIMTGYQKLHDWGNQFLQISDRKIIKWQTSGEVDLSVPVPFTTTDWMPMAEFIHEYNSQAGNTLSISPEFREEVEPAIIRVLEKHGHGLSDEQFLCAMFFQDASFKMTKMWQMKSVTKSIIEFAQEQTKQARMGIEPPVTEPKPSPTNIRETANEYHNVTVSPAQGPLPATTGMDAQSQAVADLVVSPGAGTVQQSVPTFGNERHLKRAERISKGRKTKTGKGRKPRKNTPPTPEESE